MKGSITIKRTHLLNMIANQRFIFRSRVSKDSKRFAWGRQTGFESILEEDWSRTDWNKFMEEWDSWKPWIGEGLDFILEKGEDL